VFDKHALRKKNIFPLIKTNMLNVTLSRIDSTQPRGLSFLIQRPTKPTNTTPNQKRRSKRKKMFEYTQEHEEHKNNPRNMISITEYIISN